VFFLATLVLVHETTSRQHARAISMPAHVAHLGALDPRFGMNDILPDNYTHVPGIAKFSWSTIAGDYGARLNRFSFDWQQVEPQKGTFNFQGPESFVDSDEAHTMLSIAVLEHTPYWATNVVTNNPSAQVPSGLYLEWNDPNNVWGAFVYAAAQHFAGRVAYWEVWNEPDLLNGAAWAGSAADFFQLIKVAYQAIKAADPAAQVITGSLNYNPSWLGGVFTADRADPGAHVNNYYFDAVGLHSYGRAVAPYALGQQTQQLLSQYGISGKTIIATELGIPVDDDPPSSTAGLVGASAEASSYVLEAFASALAGGIDRMLYYRASDVGEPGYWGLFKYSGAPRAPATAFEVAAKYFANVQSATLHTSGPITYVVLDEGSQRVTVVWNNAPQPARFSLYEQSAAGATTIDKADSISTITADSNGYYQLVLPPATNNHGATSSDFIIGGGPILLVENAPFVQPPTPTPAPPTSPTPSVSSTAADTATATDSPTLTPSSTPTPSVTATPTATPTASFPPDAPHTYFAAGAVGGAYSEHLDLANPNPTPARVRLTLSGPTGAISVTDTMAPGNALTSLDLGALHVPPGPVSASILSDKPLGASRALYYGAAESAGSGAASPSQTWYLPGITTINPLTQTVTIFNPNATVTGIAIQTIDAAGNRQVRTGHVNGDSSGIFFIGSRGPGPGASALVVAEQPVIAEYTAYQGAPAGLTTSMGVRDLSHVWYVADGENTTLVSSHLVLLNPDTRYAAQVTLRLYAASPLVAGDHALPISTTSLTVAASSRATVDLAGLTPPPSFSLVLTSSLPIAVNRVLTYGPGQHRAAVTMAVEHAAPAWAFPSGDTSTREVINSDTVDTGYAETLLLFNPSLTDTLTLAISTTDTGGQVLHQFSTTLTQGQCLAVSMNQLGLPPGRHATFVRSANGAHFIAEQVVYFNGGRNAYTGPGIPMG
jgi:hypothetical protein